MNPHNLDVEEWVKGALCAQVGGDFWFPENNENPYDAKRICKACPVINECLAYALRNDERDGVWGGTSPNDRRKMQRTTPCELCGVLLKPGPYARGAHMQQTHGVNGGRHGTYEGYQLHRKNKEQPCDECREANRRTCAQYRARKKQQGAA